jgi:ribosome-associated protein
MRQPDEEHIPRRSDRKRADKPVQDLARRLAELTETACQGLHTPDDLKEEILAAIRVKAHGARNRQIKRLASVLRSREQDSELLRGALSGQAAIHLDGVQSHKDLESLRERICDPDQAEAAVEEALRRFPSLDRDKLCGLSRAARSSRGIGDRRAYREIFRHLRRAQEAENAGGTRGDG